MTTIERVSPQRPYVASWRALGGHQMFVGAFESASCGIVLLATDKDSEAAGFETPEQCAAAMLAHGFKNDSTTWLDIGPCQGQLALF